VPQQSSTRPYGKFRFLVEVDGLTLAHFQSVGGLNHEIQAVEYQEGGVNDRLHKLPGQGRYPNLTLKVGYVDNRLLEGWHRNFSQTPGKVGRKNGSIVLLNDDGAEIARWNFTRAWPVKWEGPELDATQSALLVESIEIAHEGITRG
jgi:phage tail-like protein